MKNLRKVLYKDTPTKGAKMQKGWCLLITGGMMSEPIMVIERPDGYIIQRSLNLVKFDDREE